MAASKTETGNRLDEPVIPCCAKRQRNAQRRMSEEYRIHREGAPIGHIRDTLSNKTNGLSNGL